MRILAAVLCCLIVTQSADADYIQAEFTALDSLGNRTSNAGSFTVIYDPITWDPGNVNLLYQGSANFGVVAQDVATGGWTDPQAELWSVDVLGIAGDIMPFDDSLLAFADDPVQIINDGATSEIVWTHQITAETFSVPVQWDNITVATPEPDAVLLLLIGLGACIWRREWNR